MDENKYLLKVDGSHKCEKWMREGDQIIDPKYLEVIRDEEEIALFIQKLVKEEVLIFEVKKENMTLEMKLL